MEERKFLSIGLWLGMWSHEKRPTTILTIRARSAAEAYGYALEYLRSWASAQGIYEQARGCELSDWSG